MTDTKGICYCGRSMENNQHSDGGDPEWCYPEESGLGVDSRCCAMFDPEAESEGVV